MLMDRSKAWIIIIISSAIILHGIVAVIILAVNKVFVRQDNIVYYLREKMKGNDIWKDVHWCFVVLLLCREPT
jgi:hypothetical protein